MNKHVLRITVFSSLFYEGRTRTRRVHFSKAPVPYLICSRVTDDSVDVLAFWLWH